MGLDIELRSSKVTRDDNTYKLRNIVDDYFVEDGPDPSVMDKHYDLVGKYRALDWLSKICLDEIDISSHDSYSICSDNGHCPAILLTTENLEAIVVKLEESKATNLNEKHPCRNSAVYSDVMFAVGKCLEYSKDFGSDIIMELSY